MTGQPGNRLMPERVRGGLDASGLGVVLDNLLDAPGCKLAGKPGLKQIAVLRMGCEVSAKGRCERLAEQNKPILVSLPFVDANPASLKVHVGYLDRAKLGDAHGGV